MSNADPELANVRQAAPNPQGKAALPHLNELQGWRGVEPSAPSADKVVIDYLCGLLVLSADFNFKPVPGAVYHLYYRQGRWSLSLIGPQEWRPSRKRDYVASCELLHDATWHINPAPRLAEKTNILDALHAFEQAFRERMASASKLVDDLPHYERSLPYYRRVLASGLASSLAHSLHRLGLEGESGQGLLSSLPRDRSLPFSA